MPRTTPAARRPAAIALRGALCGLLALGLGAPAAQGAGDRPSVTDRSAVGGATSGAWRAETGDPAASDGTAADTAELVLAPVEPVLQPDDDAYEFEVLVRNTGDDPLPAGAVELELVLARVVETAELDLPAEGATRLLATADLAATDDEQQVTLRVPADDFPLDGQSEAGVYRLRASLVDADPGATGAGVDDVDSTTSPGDGDAEAADAADPEGEGADSANADAQPAEADAETTPGTGAGQTEGVDSTVSDAQGSQEALEPPARLSATAPVVWKGAGDATVSLSAIVPLVLPEGVLDMPDAAELEEALPRLEQLLDAAEGARATLAVDPRIVAGVRALGESAPAPLQRFLERLETTALSSFLLQFADADPSAQADLGLDELLAPQGLEFAVDKSAFPDPEEPDGGTESVDPDGETGAEADAGDAAAADPDGTAAGAADSASSEAEAADGAATTADADPRDAGTDPASNAEASASDGAADSADTAEAVTGPPSLEQLLDWPADRGVAWPAAGSVDGATIDLLRRSGIDSVILDAANVTSSGGPRVELQRGTWTVADTGLASAARRLGADPSTAEQGRALADAAAALALAAQNRSPGMVLALDRAVAADAADPARALTAFAEFDWVRMIPEEQQAAGSATLLRSDDGEPAPSASSPEDAQAREDALSAALEREGRIAELAPLLASPDLLTGYQRARVLQLFATRYAEDPTSFTPARDAFVERDETMLAGVEIVGTEHTQLLGTSAGVPLQVRNWLPFEALVVLEARPTSAALSLPEPSSEPTLVPADGLQTVLMTARTRVSSGDSGLLVTLADASGEQVFATSLLEISISSSFERIALTVLATLAALLLGFGIWRSVRRHGRRPEPGS